MFEYARSQICGGAGFVPEGGVMCGLQACPGGAIRVGTTRRPVGAGPEVVAQQVGNACVTPGGPAGAAADPAGVDVAGAVAAEFAVLPLGGATARVQPAGSSLVNVPTVFWTQAAPEVFAVVVAGQAVQVVASPVGYTWHVGDGTVLGPTVSAGAPYPQGEITHTYTAAGVLTARVDVTWTGTYAVAGGPPAPIPGTVTVAGPGVAVTVREARSQLVATPDA